MSALCSNLGLISLPGFSEKYICIVLYIGEKVLCRVLHIFNTSFKVLNTFKVLVVLLVKY